MTVLAAAAAAQSSGTSWQDVITLAIVVLGILGGLWILYRN